MEFFVVFAITIPGKSGALTVRYPSASAALAKIREMEADGAVDIDVKNAKGEPVLVDELENQASETEAARPPSIR